MRDRIPDLDSDGPSRLVHAGYGRPGTCATEWLDQHPGEAQTVDDYRFLAQSFIIPTLGAVAFAD